MNLQQRLEAGLAHHRAGRLREAEAIYRRILAEQPDFGDALHLLGGLAAQVGQHDAAIDLLTKAIATNPKVPVYHGNLGAIYQNITQFDKAIPELERAIQLDQQIAEPYYNLSSILTDQGELDRAIAVLRKGITFHPNWAELHNNLGIVLRTMGKYDQALASLKRSVALRPAYAEGHWSLGHLMLLVGDFANGWVEYEWRTKLPDIVRPRNFSPPPWKGEKLNGRTILLHAEQGFGDTLQFIRYLPLVLERGGRVVVECPLELGTVLRGVDGIAEIYTQGQTLPPFDTHCSIMSLPLTFGTTLQTIPAKVPYLNVPSDRVAAWRERLGEKDDRLRVGLVWAGGPQHKDDKRRSMRLEQLAPLSEVKSARFYSLQKGPPASQAAAPPPGMQLINWTDDLHDYVETAALMANLDLIISVDTSIAHLAGALGKPVWVLLPFAPDWRWMLNRADSPWYPTMRLYRQANPENWADVMAEVVRNLTKRGRS
ncbi:MAG TPA: tetratricopeptide repeat-containing glycosyltransferase family protein [Tepidisphaeraceae bacterium]|nr:tetratricopeptide repeat-containing glycosyltransferase family protein [Tepidisphaeraceae bacterium]